MAKINVLSSKIFNRIAAGEVVERPASVVKELVENSIDANATSISISIERGGLDSIEIVDNGCGIDKSELKKALLPHSTSKISCMKDLENISTLGFRGEALASVSAISKLTIISKPATQENGAKIYSEGGEISDVIDYASADGTKIVVNNIFFNTPARARFLKSDKSEESEITSCIQKFILGNPNIAFKYIVNGQVKLQSFGDGYESAFFNVYGKDVINNCYYIDTEKNGIQIKGYIGNSCFSKANRTYQTLFVNGRYVINQTISSAITNAYQPYLMTRQYPFFVISINLPSDFVDVNVHPNKLEVRFADNRVVYGAIYSVVSKVLDGSSDALNIICEDKSNILKQDNTQFLNETKPLFNKELLKNESFKFDTLLFNDSGVVQEKQNKHNVEVDIFAENKAFLEKLEREQAEKNNQQTVNIDNELFASKTNIVSQTMISVDKEIKYIGQVLNTYLIVEYDGDVIFIDQHAAHERILYDKIIQSFSNKDIAVQQLLIPFVISLNSYEFEFISEKLDVIKNMGIDLEIFGDNSLKVSAVPIYLSNMNIDKFFQNILAETNSLRQISATDLLKDRFAQMACKSAIKSGDNMTGDEAKVLLERMNYNLGLKCPHGRPVCVKITRTEIDKWFKRIV